MHVDKIIKLKHFWKMYIKKNLNKHEYKKHISKNLAHYLNKIFAFLYTLLYVIDLF